MFDGVFTARSMVSPRGQDLRRRARTFVRSHCAPRRGARRVRRRQARSETAQKRAQSVDLSLHALTLFEDPGVHRSLLAQERLRVELGKDGLEDLLVGAHSLTFPGSPSASRPGSRWFGSGSSTSFRAIRSECSAAPHAQSFLPLPAIDHRKITTDAAQNGHSATTALAHRAYAITRGVRALLHSLLDHLSTLSFAMRRSMRGRWNTM